MTNLPFLSEKNLSEELKRSMGAKAKNLNDLLSAGFAVPDGFVLFKYEKDLEDAVKKIGGFPVAVRSSGSLEDLPNASFAGLYETFLEIQNAQELSEAIEKCFDSKNSERVKDYLKTKKISYDERNLTMSVLVQKMVKVQIAGVLFTLNPTNGHEEELYLEFCEGLGERLVSGHVTPSRMTYDWMSETIVESEVNTEGTVLDEKSVKDLVHDALKIQAHYGKPQDIEWAIDECGKVYILQSRPITTFIPREDRPELTNADFKDGGVSARVCTPLMYSVYRNAMQFSMGEYLKKIKLISSDEGIQWIYAGYGRAYWNAEAVKNALKKIPDFKEKDFDRDLGLQKDYGAAGPFRTPISFASVISAIPVLIGLNQEFNDCITMIDQFRDSFEKRVQQLKSLIGEIQHLSERDFSDWFLKVIQFQNETEKKYFRTIYNNSNFQTEFKSYLKKLSCFEDGDEISLMSDLQGVNHLDVQSGLQKLSIIKKREGISLNYLAERKAFLEIHYHHGPAELDLTVPRWGEREDWVDELVDNFSPSLIKKRNIFEEIEEKYRKRLSFFSRKQFLSKLKTSRNFLRLREEMRTYSTRAYYLLRLGVLEFSRRNQLKDFDVFFYDLDEIKLFLANRMQTLPDVEKRKLFYFGYKFFQAPNEFGGKILSVKSSITSQGLKGIGCSPGEIIGMARVVLDIHETKKLKKDEILVTLFTDPGWTPVLARVGGVITEVGGLLSHAAVIGREYGIPAILNLIDATKLIQDGDLIKINGKTGEVEILEKVAKSST